MNFCDPDWGNSFLYMTLKSQQKEKKIGISLVVQWLTTCLPMQETQVWSLVWGDSTCQGATKPVCHNCWACALESRNYWAPVPRAHAPQQESHCNEKPTQHTERAPLTATRDSLCKEQHPAQPKSFWKDKFNSMKSKTVCAKDTTQKVKRQPKDGRKHLQTI